MLGYSKRVRDGDKTPLVGPLLAHALVAALFALIALAVSFLVMVAQTVDACYTQPCYQGWGLSGLWRVNRGASYGALAAATAVLMHALGGLMLLQRGIQLGEAHFVVGVYVGISLVASLLMVSQCFVWGAEWRTIRGLLELSDLNHVFQESGRRMHARASLKYRCLTLFWLAVATAGTQLLIVVLLLIRRSRLLIMLRASQEGSNERESPLLAPSGV